MDSHFDSEKFILEIENRPAIWNSACSDYSNRDIKKKCWEELIDKFSCKYNTVQEKNEIGEYMLISSPYYVNRVVLYELLNII